MTSLASLVATATRRALAAGSLVPIATDVTTVEDRGIPFQVHVTSLQDAKARAAIRRDAPSDPFSEPDPALVVADLRPAHLAVLNKFNVLEHHLLVVTRDFEHQEDPLRPDDFEALCRCMAQIDGLGFYNAGTVAGASQPHKHLQLVPVPLAGGQLPTPVDAVIGPPAARGGPTRLRAFDFPHVLVPLDGRPIDPVRSHDLWTLFDDARRSLGIADGQPYNLLVTRRWMLVVPRCRELWRGVSVNALGFAGSLLVRNRSELDELRRGGPLAALRSVVEPSS